MAWACSACGAPLLARRYRCCPAASATCTPDHPAPSQLVLMWLACPAATPPPPQADFFLACEPSWLEKRFPDKAARCRRPAVALLSPDKTWMT